MVVINKEGTIIFTNIQTERVFGYRKKELLGQKIEILLPERYRVEHVAQRDGYLSAPVVRPMGAGLDLIARHKSGKEFPVEISLSPLPTKDGLIVTSAIRDISDRKRIESELKDARQLADTANRAKSEFLANMSHEIRTPLAGILGYAEMLIDYCKTDEERRDYGAKIKRNADNLTELINDILDLSKVEAGALKIEQLSFSPLVELESVLSLLQVQVEEKQLAIETQIERPVPAQIVSDPTRLRQILVNLLGNAIKFTDTGKITVKLQMKDKASSKLSFSVIDTGCGIPLAAQPKLFQPFVQADSSTTRKYGGTGLGLVLSRRLAVALGGDLVLQESAPGRGSTFVFTIDIGPGVESVDTARDLGHRSSQTYGRSIRIDNVRVLLAEDRPDNEEFITKVLTNAGGSVAVARNGAEAVSLARSQPFDVVLMDMQMPVMDGYAATRELLKAGYPTPIVAVTAHAMIEEREKCEAVGCSKFLTKPLDIAELLGTIRALTHKK